MIKLKKLLFFDGAGWLLLVFLIAMGLILGHSNFIVTGSVLGILLCISLIIHFSSRDIKSFLNRVDAESENPILVRELMVRDVYTVSKHEKAIDAAQKMVKHDIGGIIVAEKGRPIGVLTERDFMREFSAKGKAAGNVLVMDIMTKSPITVGPEKDIYEIARIMLRRRIKRLPVVSKGKLVGKISQTDLIDKLDDIRVVKPIVDRPFLTKELMVKDVITVGKKEGVMDAAKKMMSHDIGSIIVKEKNQPIGILTERDLMREFSAKDKSTEKRAVKDAMTSDLICVTPITSISKVIEIMTKHKIKRIPVVDNGKLVGKINQTDLVRHLGDVQISKTIENKVKRDKKYDLEPGLYFDRNCYGIFADQVKAGKYGLCLTTLEPSVVSKRYELRRTPILEISSDLEYTYDTILRFISKAKNPVVMLDGLEMFIEDNPISEIADWFYKLKEKAANRNAIFLMCIDPDNREHLALMRELS